MYTMYLIVITLIGGLLALFMAAGWSSYKNKKLPATPVLFRWFITGILSTGLAAYAWIFGAGGDPTQILESVTDALEVKNVVGALTGGGSNNIIANINETVQTVAESVVNEIKVGMPDF